MTECKRIRCFLHWTIAAILCLAQASSPAFAADSAKILAERISQLSQDAKGANADLAGEKSFKISLLLDQLLKKHPTSIEARLVEHRDTLPNIKGFNVAVVRSDADRWARSHPQEAQEIRSVFGQDPDVVLVLDAGPQNAAPVPEPEEPAKPDDMASTTVPLKLPTKPGGALKIPNLSDSVAATPAPSTPTAPNARKVTRSQVMAHLRESTVLIYAFDVDDTGSFTGKYSTGSGSFIAPGRILTNHHVVDEAYKSRTLFFIMNKSIGFHQATLLHSAQVDTPLKIDAAILAVDSVKDHSTLSINPKPVLDEWLAIAGYPGDASKHDVRASQTARAIFNGKLPTPENLPNALVDEGRLNNIIFSQFFQSEELQYTMITAPGNSGSPVVNACGEIIGLHYRGSGTEIKYNSSVHSRDVAVFLDLVDIDYQRQNQECQVGYGR